MSDLAMMKALEENDSRNARELKDITSSLAVIRREVQEAQKKGHEVLWCIERRASSDQAKHKHRHYGHEPQRSKVEFSYFCREDPDTWMDKADYYFHFYDVLREERVVTASRNLEGDAQRWCRWLKAKYVKEGAWSGQLLNGSLGSNGAYHWPITVIEEWPKGSKQRRTPP